jgi:hypothetical protein
MLTCGLCSLLLLRFPRAQYILAYERPGALGLLTAAVHAELAQRDAEAKHAAARARQTSTPGAGGGAGKEGGRAGSRQKGEPSGSRPRRKQASAAA